MSDTVYYCVLCEWSGEIPEDAQQLTTGFAGRSIVVRFGDGTVHSLKKQRIKKQRIKKVQEQNNGISN
jgi:hypothetical protein